jgi:ATPase family associated with various cellular activities (AAA)
VTAAAPPPTLPPLPAWAEEMRSLFRAGSASQFLLYGNVFDLLAAPDGKGGVAYVPLRTFLTQVMFEPFDVVIHYDRGRGIRVKKGADHFYRFLKAFDAFQGTSWASLPQVSGEQALDLGGLLPRDPGKALEIIDRFLRGSLYRTREGDGGGRVPAPLKVAVLVDYVAFLAPQGDPLYLSGDLSQTLIRLVDWASDPAVTGAFFATVLVAENLSDVNRQLAENPYSAKLKIELPTAAELGAFVEDLTAGQADFAQACAVSRQVLAEKLVGLSRVNVRSLLLRALSGGAPITVRYLTEVKKELIEKEAFGRIEFIESSRTLDAVAGHVEAKAWLRQDAELLRRGRLAAIPMGYLLTGRIGTGKTFLVECWAGEVGIPVVALSNFREKWVGATEGNLEKVFNILRALGQVVVFVDEADQMTGRRGASEGDSGLSGRIYGMLAKEMSDTTNRGKILWVFATSRPDLLEVDLKRQGRLDVHIPLFPPVDPKDRRELFVAMAKKVGLGLAPAELPDPPADEQVGGNEMEGILVRALRLHATQPDGAPGEPLPAIIRDVMADFRPSAHVERLELMDLLAVKEATDARFLPERFRKLSLPEVNHRIEELRLRLGE